jgi:hypothetical protein
MVKAGKFGHRNLEFAVNTTLPATGLNAPTKTFWWGTVMKNRNAGTVMTLTLHGGTTHGNFDWIEYAEIRSRPYSGTTAGLIAGTVNIYYNHSPTLFVEATSNIGRQSVFLFVIGRDARG